MLKSCSSLLSSALLSVCLCVVFALPIIAQVPNINQERSNKIQLTIERSEESLQKGEEFFQAGEYAQARRSYDRALELILEAGIDVRSDARLKQHYQKLITQINQRQATLTKQLPTPLPLSAQAKDEMTDAQAAQLAKQNQVTNPGQPGYSSSPLDDIAKLNLTEEERKATEAEARAALMAAKIDFGFKPNALVQSWINYYQGRGRTTMERGLQRSGKYMSMARRIFKEEGVPQDLAWLGQVESAWSPNARSWAAAVGLWQFIPGTAARFGLRQDYYIDERSSYEKATRASARYLKFLANRYAGNWELAMAAYNSGEGNVDRAIARSGYADFWEIYQRGLLPNETRNYEIGRASCRERV